MVIYTLRRFSIMYLIVWIQISFSQNENSFNLKKSSFLVKLEHILQIIQEKITWDYYSFIMILIS